MLCLRPFVPHLIRLAHGLLDGFLGGSSVLTPFNFFAAMFFVYLLVAFGFPFFFFFLPLPVCSLATFYLSMFTKCLQSVYWSFCCWLALLVGIGFVALHSTSVCLITVLRA